jgi:micrococcal nuclease
MSLPLLRRLPASTLLLLILLWPALCPPARAPADNRGGAVHWIYDGDSIEVAGIGPVRLLGIDSPEHKTSGRDAWFRRQGIAPAVLRRINKEGRRFLIANVKNLTVALSCEPESRDRHGRLLAYVTLPDGRLLNRLMLEKGYAVVYRRFDFALKDDFLAAEAEARRNKVGLWE